MSSRTVQELIHQLKNDLTYVVVLEDHNGFKKGEIYEINDSLVLENLEKRIENPNSRSLNPRNPDLNKIAFCKEHGTPISEITYLEGEEIEKDTICRVKFPEDFLDDRVNGRTHSVAWTNGSQFSIELDGVPVCSIKFNNEDVTVVEGSFENVKNNLCD